MSEQVEKGFENTLYKEHEHGQEPDINKKLIINMRDLNHVMRALYEGKASQKRILIMLNEVESITQRDLTMRLGIQPGSASEILSKLENAGFISRTMSETDRRTANISLTEKGIQAAVEAAGQRSRRHVEMFSCLAENEKTELLALLEKLNTDWAERYGTADGERRGRHHHCGRGCERENRGGYGRGQGHGPEESHGHRHAEEMHAHFQGDGSESAHHPGHKHGRCHGEAHCHEEGHRHEEGHHHEEGHRHEEGHHHEEGYRHEDSCRHENEAPIETEEPGHVEIH